MKFNFGIGKFAIGLSLEDLSIGCKEKSKEVTRQTEIACDMVDKISKREVKSRNKADKIHAKAERKAAKAKEKADKKAAKIRAKGTQSCQSKDRSQKFRQHRAS